MASIHVGWLKNKLGEKFAPKTLISQVVTNDEIPLETKLQNDLNEIKAEVTDAIATAKTETIQTILGEAVDADFDTLQEVAEWIEADTTNSAELMVRVTNIENDYYNSKNLIPMTEADIDEILNS